MPTIASFHGIAVRMYPHDHQPPHFHAFHGDDEVLVGLYPLGVLQGGLSKPRQKQLLDWAARHLEELRECWRRCQNHQPVPSVPHP